MGHFYASIEGNRGMATRMGSKKSGIQGHVRGWGIGARVYCYYDDERQCDAVTVEITKGSRGYSSQHNHHFYKTFYENGEEK